MEKKKKFEVLVTQVNQFSRKFVIEANSDIAARNAVREYVKVHPLDQRRGTYEGSDVTMIVVGIDNIESGPRIWFRPLTHGGKSPKGEKVNPRQTEFEVRKAFGSVIRRLREDLDMGPRDLGYLVDLNKATIGVLERGETGCRLYNFLRIATALRKSPEDLIRLIVNEYNKNNTEEPG